MIGELHNNAQWPDEEVQRDVIESESLGERLTLAVQQEPSAKLEGLR